MKTITFDVTQRVTVTFDPSKFGAVMTDFNACVSDFGFGEDALERHAKHLANLHVVNMVDCSPENTIEGYGKMADAGVTVKILEDYLYVERQFPEGGA